MNKPTKKELYNIIDKMRDEQIKRISEEEKTQQLAYMRYFDGAYIAIKNILKRAFGGLFCLLTFEHVDSAGFWFTFELVNDTTRQTYRISHEEAKAEHLKLLYAMGFIYGAKID